MAFESILTSLWLSAKASPKYSLSSLGWYFFFFFRSPIIAPVCNFFGPVQVIILPVGYQIIKDVDFPWPLANIVYQHHERLDGSGYPQGLKGDEICLEAKIISVADVVEAITSHRPYRPALGIDVALQEIERGSGQIYDPIVAEACTKLFKEQGFELNPSGQ